MTQLLTKITMQSKVYEVTTQLATCKTKPTKLHTRSIML